MRIGIILDNTVALSAKPIVDLLGGICHDIQFVALEDQFHIGDDRLTKRKIKAYFERCGIRRGGMDAIVAFTSVRYDDYAFYEDREGLYIVSLDEWNAFTDLPQANGMVYFIAQILIELLRIGKAHADNTGCLNDFLDDKSGVNAGMRAAYICRACQGARVLPDGEKRLLADVNRILDALSDASRASEDVISRAPAPVAAIPAGRSGVEERFDTYICYNSLDEPAVRDIKAKLNGAGIRTWFDKDQLMPGDIYQQKMYEQIMRCPSAVVFVGDRGTGPWEKFEVFAFLKALVKRGCLVVPTILPGTRHVPELPPLLEEIQYADLRENTGNGLERLTEALRAHLA